METLLLIAEREIRATRALSEATCQALARADEAARCAFGPSFAFLGCPASAAAANGDVVPPAHRIAAIRLMLLRVCAHTAAPQWSSRMLAALFDAARQPSGATLGDIVRGLFTVLAECPPGLSGAQANFIREVSIYVVGKQRRAYAEEDFSWLATALTAVNAEINAAQAYLAAYTLPPSLVPACRGSILRALHATRFEEEVRRELLD